MPFFYFWASHPLVILWRWSGGPMEMAGIWLVFGMDQSGSRVVGLRIRMGGGICKVCFAKSAEMRFFMEKVCVFKKKAVILQTFVTFL